MESEDCLFDNEVSLMAFYRYAPITVITACGMREDFMKTLTENGDFSPLVSKLKKKKGMQPFWEKLTKIAMLKGKYKYR